MHSLREERLALEQIESEADFVVFSEEHGVVSEHYTAGEARMAFFQEASGSGLGDRLPSIYRREEPYWVPLS